MERKQQIKILEQILDSAKEKLLANAEKFPESWDGYEIREYVKDYIAENYTRKGSLDRSARRNYKNDLITYNL